MTFTLNILAREITAAIAACASVVDSHSQIPILRCTRIHVADGQASFTATNTDQTVVAKAACDGAGVICIDTAALSAKVQTLKPDATVSFAGDGKSVTITQGRTRWVAPVMIDDFPVQVAKSLDAEGIIVHPEYMWAIAEVQGVIDPGHAMLAITGVRLQDRRVIATDGKRARVVTLDRDIPVPATLPGRFAAKLAGMFPDGGLLRATETLLSLETPNLMVNSRLVDGHYPDIDRIIGGFKPKLVNTITCGTDDLIAAMKRAGAIAASGEKATSFLNMQLRFREGEIEVVTRNLSGEEGETAVAAKRTGADADIGFNGYQLIDDISSMDSETISIAYADSETPVIITAGNSMRFVQARVFR